MNGKVKKGLGIGCLVGLVAMLIVAGAATWYASRINREYKAVQRSEDALRAAVGETAFTPPADLHLEAARLDAFLAVRDTLAGVRSELEAAVTGFAREQERNRAGGLGGFLNMVGAGSDLAPVYARYWQTRNEALRARLMGPDEYIWIYRVVYYVWLDKDPDEGREAGAPAPEPFAPILGELPPASLDLLAPRRLAFEAGYSPLLNPIELIFSGTE